MIALCIPLDAVKINNLFPDPNEVCQSLLQHCHVAVLAGFSPIAGSVPDGSCSVRNPTISFGCMNR